jgi:hypothetical protein
MKFDKIEEKLYGVLLEVFSVLNIIGIQTVMLK